MTVSRRTYGEMTLAELAALQARFERQRHGIKSHDAIIAALLAIAERQGVSHESGETVAAILERAAGQGDRIARELIAAGVLGRQSVAWSPAPGSS